MVDTMIARGRPLPPRDALDRIHTRTDRDLKIMIAATESQISRRANNEGKEERARGTKRRSHESETERKPAKRMNSTLARWDEKALAGYTRQMEMDVT